MRLEDLAKHDAEAASVHQILMRVSVAMPTRGAWNEQTQGEPKIAPNGRVEQETRLTTIVANGAIKGD